MHGASRCKRTWRKKNLFVVGLAEFVKIGAGEGSSDKGAQVKLSAVSTKTLLTVIETLCTDVLNWHNAGSRHFKSDAV